VGQVSCYATFYCHYQVNNTTSSISITLQTVPRLFILVLVFQWLFRLFMFKLNARMFDYVYTRDLFMCFEAVLMYFVYV